MKKILTPLLMCLLLALSACSSLEPNSKIVGTYQLSSVNLNGVETQINLLITMLEQMFPNENFECITDSKLELKSDYTFETIINCESQDEIPFTIGNGTYQIDGKNISFTETENETIIEGIFTDNYNSFTIEMAEEFEGMPFLVKITLTKK